MPKRRSRVRYCDCRDCTWIEDSNNNTGASILKDEFFPKCLVLFGTNVDRFRSDEKVEATIDSSWCQTEIPFVDAITRDGGSGVLTVHPSVRSDSSSETAELSIAQLLGVLQEYNEDRASMNPLPSLSKRFQEMECEIISTSSEVRTMSKRCGLTANHPGSLHNPDTVIQQVRHSLGWNDLIVLHIDGSDLPSSSFNSTMEWMDAFIKRFHSFEEVMIVIVAGLFKVRIMTSRLLILFRNDLRIHDNILLHTASTRVQHHEANEVLPIYCFDPRQFGLNFIDFKHRITAGAKLGLHRGRFLLESVLDLKSSLRSIQSDLLVAIGRPEEVLERYLSPDENLILMQKEVTREETNVERSIRRSMLGKAKLELHWGPTLVHLEDVPFEESLRDFPNIPQPFLERVIQKVYPDLAAEMRNLFSDVQPGSLPLPKDPKLINEFQYFPKHSDLPYHDSIKGQSPPHHPQGVLKFKGGEKAGLERLRRYIWDRNGLEVYLDRKNELTGADSSSKLSPWLAMGCISPRHVYREIIKFEKRRRVNQSTIQMKYTLAYRDWTKFIALKHGSRIFAQMGVLGGSDSTPIRWINDRRVIQRWCEGLTGIPFADANLRELKHTGYISNRGRISVANYFAIELQMDWRFGAAHFEQCLIDYDVTSNWVNWLIAANLLNEKNVHLRILKQSMELDPDGEYIKKWIPELGRLPPRLIHRPWLSPVQELSQYGVVLGRTYPFPIAGRYLERSFV